MTNFLRQQNIFKQNIHSRPEPESYFNQLLILILPLLVVGYLMALGSVSSIENAFASSLLLIGAFYLIKKQFCFSRELKVLLGIGFALFVMVFLQALIGGKIEMLFKFQFANLRNMLILPFILAVIVNLKLSPQSLWRIIVLSGLYTFFYSILVIVERPERGIGLLEEAIVIGNMGIMFSLMSLVAIFAINGRYWKLLASVVFLSGLVLSVLSGTRAGWVALLVTGCILLWVFYGQNRRYFLMTSFGFVLLTVLAVLFWNFLPIEQRILAAVNDLAMYSEGNSNSSIGARLDMWKIGLLAFTENPVFGWGVTPYKETFVAYLNNGIGNFNLVNGHTGYAQPHNDYVLVLYHFGIVGFGLVMSFILYPAFVFIKKMNQAKLKGNSEMVYVSLTGLVAIEVLLDFMMFNLAFMNKLFYVYIIIVLMSLTILTLQEAQQHKKV